MGIVNTRWLNYFAPVLTNSNQYVMKKKKKPQKWYYVYFDLKGNCVRVYKNRFQLHLGEDICYDTLTSVFGRMGRFIYSKDDFRIFYVQEELVESKARHS